MHSTPPKSAMSVRSCWLDFRKQKYRGTLRRDSPHVTRAGANKKSRQGANRNNLNASAGFLVRYERNAANVRATNPGGAQTHLHDPSLITLTRSREAGPQWVSAI